MVDNGDGSSTVTCNDGSSAVIGPDDDCTFTDLGDGRTTVDCEEGGTTTLGPESGCTLTSNEDGTSTITCGDGTSGEFTCAERGYPITGCDDLLGTLAFDCAPAIEGAAADTTETHYACGDLPPSAPGCDFACGSGGCVEDFWMMLDLGAAQPLTELRFRGNWHSGRPATLEVWASDDPNDLPDGGARRLASITAHPSPWRCVSGEVCDSDTPDACCPDGRDAPQDTRAVGEFHAKYDILRFDKTEARYFFFMVRDTREPDLSIFRVSEVEARGPRCD